MTVSISVRQERDSIEAGFRIVTSIIDPSIEALRSPILIQSSAVSGSEFALRGCTHEDLYVYGENSLTCFGTNATAEASQAYSIAHIPATGYWLRVTPLPIHWAESSTHMVQVTMVPTYVFIVGASTAAEGDTYLNSGEVFTVLSTIAGAITLYCTGTGAPAAAGNLVRITGAGTDPIVFSSVTVLTITPPDTLTIPKTTGTTYSIIAASPALAIDGSRRAILLWDDPLADTIIPGTTYTMDLGSGGYMSGFVEIQDCWPIYQGLSASSNTDFAAAYCSILQGTFTGLTTFTGRMEFPGTVPSGELHYDIYDSTGDLKISGGHGVLSRSDPSASTFRVPFFYNIVGSIDGAIAHEAAIRAELEALITAINVAGAFEGETTYTY